MNKKLVKKVAVASLAALMTIPNIVNPLNDNKVYAGVTSSGTIISPQKQVNPANSSTNVYIPNNTQTNVNYSEPVRLKDGITLEWARQREAELAQGLINGTIEGQKLTDFYKSLVNYIPYENTPITVNGISSHGVDTLKSTGFTNIIRGFGRTMGTVVDAFLTDVRYIGPIADGVDRYEVDFFAPCNSPQSTDPILGENYRENLSRNYKAVSQFEYSGGTYIVDMWSNEVIERESVTSDDINSGLYDAADPLKFAYARWQNHHLSSTTHPNNEYCRSIGLGRAEYPDCSLYPGIAAIIKKSNQ